MLNPRYWLLMHLVSLLFLLPPSSPKQHTSSFTIPSFRRQQSWAYIDRMHLDPGQMKLKSKISFHSTNFKTGSHYEIELVAIPQSIWQLALKHKCNTRILPEQQRLELRRRQVVFNVYLVEGNQYVESIQSSLEVVEEESYHFVARECSKKLVNDGYGRQAKLDIWIDVRNNDKHTSSTQDLYGWLLPMLIVSAAGMLYFLFRDREEDGDNWIKLLLKISLSVGVVSIVFKYIGFVVYAYDSGVNYNVFDVFYLLLHAISDSILMVLLMLLSFGWTVTFRNARDFDLYVPLACMLGLVNIIMTMLNKIADGEHDKYHMYDTIPAYIMIGFRMVGLAVFFFGIGQSWLTLKKKEDEKVKKYLVQLAVLGTAYLAFVPLGFVIVRYVGTRYRKEVMFFLVELARFGMSYWLAVLAGWKKSAYRSIIDSSFMEKDGKFL